MTPLNQNQYPPLAIILRNGTPAVIRPLAETDGAALAQFYAGIPPEDELFYCPHPLTSEYAFKNAGQAASPTEVVLVLTTAGMSIGGYAWYRWVAGADVSGFGICVARSCQGAGAGPQLMARLLEIARVVGPPVMSLTVQKKNSRGVELYAKMGFRVIREQLRAADSEPEYYMQRSVREVAIDPVA